MLHSQYATDEQYQILKGLNVQLETKTHLAIFRKETYLKSLLKKSLISEPHFTKLQC